MAVKQNKRRRMHSLSRRNRWICAIALTVAAMVVASCSSDGGNGSAGNTSSLASTSKRTTPSAAGSNTSGKSTTTSTGSQSGQLFPVTYVSGVPALAYNAAPYATLIHYLGYDKESGITEQAEPTSGATQALQLVLTGHGEITCCGLSSAYPLGLKNPNLRIVAVHQHNIWNILVPADSPVHSLKDLKGKQVGVQSLASASYLFARADVASAGLTPDKDVKFVSINVGAPAAQALKAGTIAAFASYNGASGIVANLLGEPVRFLKTPLDSLPATSALMMNANFIKDHRPQAVALLRSIYKANIFAVANPKAAVEIHWLENPDQAPKGTAAEKNAALNAAAKAALPAWEEVVPKDDPATFGEADMKQIQDAANFMEKYGILKQHVDVSKFVDLSLLPDAKKGVDIQQIQKSAENWKH